MVAILGLVMPLLSGILTPFVKAWSDYKRTELTTNEAGFAAGVAGDVQTTQALLQADVADNAIKAQLYGSGVYRFVEWFVGGLVALHFGLVFLATILASKFLFGHDVLGVPQAPGPYGATFEWAIISSFFIVRAAHGGPSNVARWLGPKS
jgi:hypothetical protein